MTSKEAEANLNVARARAVAALRDLELAATKSALIDLSEEIIKELEGHTCEAFAACCVKDIEKHLREGQPP